MDQNQLTLIPQRETTCSAALWRSLTSGIDGGQAIRLVAKTPALREEAQRVASSLWAKTQEPPAPAERFVAELIRHALALGVSDRSQAEWADLFSIYQKALGHFSMAAIESAFDRWHKRELYPNDPGRHGFFPKPAELYELAQRYMNEIGMAAYRARKAIEFAEDKGVEWTPERKRIEREKAVALGYITEDGKPILAPVIKTIPDAPTGNPQADQGDVI